MVNLRVAGLVSAALALCGLAAVTLSAADKPTDDKPAAAGPSDERYFEMRTYHAAPGKLDALHARFRDHTLRLFKKHGIESIAYWTVIDEDDEKDTMVFILAYPSADDRDKLWNAFAKDPEWVKAKAESEVNGPLVEKVDQVFMKSTGYSPLK